ncbi:hypothetical protein NDQ72_01405 [Halomonas sp. KG2]|uniref:hypothetical protein n=1 Tax=Halomonas sp. KG2 TaxID=2951138 RepID=UPI002648660A|nr:hypothetical protein [Halomonas sp. KG2]WKD28631.1 hypothetical protein NDQ72_01405 [Halomonas sp. KG2]
MPEINSISPKASVRSPRPSVDQQMVCCFTADERESIEKLAQNEMRSLSATIRMLSLRGLSQYQQDTLIAD